MTVTSFEQLLSLRVFHAYYEGICADFDFVFPAESIRLIERGRLLSKIRDGVLYLLFEVKKDKIPRVSLAGSVLRIGLRLTQPLFANFTTPPPPSAPNVLFYRNATTKLTFDAPESRRLVGAIFSHTLAKKTPPVGVILQDIRGDAITTKISPVSKEADDSLSVSFDLTSLAPGPLSIIEDYGAGEIVTTRILLHPELQRIGVTCVVDIEVDGLFYEANPTLELRFGAPEETLRYYVVVSDDYPDAGFFALDVVDGAVHADSADALEFERMNPADVAADLTARTLLGTSTARIAVFTSNKVVPRRQRVRKNLQLVRNDLTLVPHLPLPGADRADSNIILHVSK